MLGYLYRRFAGLPFTLEQANGAAAGSVSGGDLRAAIPDMLRSGQLIGLKRSRDERMYCISRSALPGIWEGLQLRTPKAAQESLVKRMKETGRGLDSDVFRTLAWIGQQGRLSFTSKGALYRKSIDKLEERISLREEDLIALGLQHPHQDWCPLGLAVVLDMLLSLGLLSQVDSGLVIVEEQLSAWLAMDALDRETLLLQELLNRYLPDIPGIWHIAYRLLQPDLEVGSWYSANSLLECLEDSGLLSAMTDYERQWLDAWLLALSSFGWLELGRDPEELLMFRWCSRPGLTGNYLAAGQRQEGQRRESAGRCYVQPDFEILVPPDVSLHIRWELECCCECLVNDRMTIYRLTRSRAAYAYQRGRTPLELLEWLKAYSYPVPDNITQVLMDWEREFRDAEQQSMPLYPRIEPDLEGQDRLAKRNDQAWVYQGFKPYLYEAAEGVPGVDEIFPGRSLVPSIWMKERRQYHGSTAQSLMDQAMLWRTGVEMLLKSGEQVLFLPSEILPGDNYWMVQGSLVRGRGREQLTEENIRLAPDQWTEIGLLMPEMR